MAPPGVSLTGPTPAAPARARGAETSRTKVQPPPPPPAAPHPNETAAHSWPLPQAGTSFVSTRELALADADPWLGGGPAGLTVCCHQNVTGVARAAPEAVTARTASPRKIW